MGSTRTDLNEPEDRDLLVRLDGGDEEAMTELFSRHRERLVRFHQSAPGIFT
jgi:hypothetical protein